MRGRESVVGAVGTVVFVGGNDLAAVGTGQVFGFFADGRANVGAAGPGAVGGDLADAAAVLAEMPVGGLAIAVRFAGVDLHVEAGLSQGDF